MGERATSSEAASESASESGMGGSGGWADPPEGAEMPLDESFDESPGERSTASPLEERFSSFVTAHRSRALRLAWRLTGGDPDAAEDVAQDAFVKAYRHLDQFRGDAKLETWFYRILVRQAANHRRWRAVRDRWSGLFPDDAPDPSPRGPGDPALRSRIAAALDALTHRQREAFVLVHMEGFSVREAAQMSRLAQGTVKSHLHRALVHLREQLGDLRETDPSPSESEARHSANGGDH